MCLVTHSSLVIKCHGTAELGRQPARARASAPAAPLRRRAGLHSVLQLNLHRVCFASSHPVLVVEGMIDRRP